MPIVHGDPVPVTITNLPPQGGIGDTGAKSWGSPTFTATQEDVYLAKRQNRILKDAESVTVVNKKAIVEIDTLEKKNFRIRYDNWVKQEKEKKAFKKQLDKDDEDAQKKLALSKMDSIRNEAKAQRELALADRKEIVSQRTEQRQNRLLARQEIAALRRQDAQQDKILGLANIPLAAAAGGLAAGAGAMNAYVSKVGELELNSHKVSQNFKDISAQTVRAGRLVAEVMVPDMNRMTAMANDIISFLEKNPDIVAIAKAILTTGAGLGVLMKTFQAMDATSLKLETMSINFKRGVGQLLPSQQPGYVPPSRGGLAENAPGSSSVRRTEVAAQRMENAAKRFENGANTVERAAKTPGGAKTAQGAIAPFGAPTKLDKAMLAAQQALFLAEAVALGAQIGKQIVNFVQHALKIPESTWGDIAVNFEKVILGAIQNNFILLNEMLKTFGLNIDEQIKKNNDLANKLFADTKDFVDGISSERRLQQQQIKDFASENVAAFKQAREQREQMEKDLQQALVDIDKQYADQRIKINEQMAKQAADVMQNYFKSLDALSVNYTKQSIAAQIAYDKQRKSIEESTVKAIANIREGLLKQLAEMEKQHLKTRKEIIDDRDALALEAEDKRYAEEKSSAKKAADDAIKAIEKQQAEQLQSLSANYAEQQKIALASYEEQQAELKKQSDQQLQDIQDAGYLQIEELKKQQQKEEIALQEGYDKQLVLLNDSFKKSMASLNMYMSGTIDAVQKQAAADLAAFTEYLRLQGFGNNGIFPPTLPRRDHAAGGPTKAGWAMLHDNEYVLNAKTAAKAETILGKKLTQENALTVGSGSGTQITNNFQLASGATLTESRKIISQAKDEVLALLADMLDPQALAVA